MLSTRRSERVLDRDRGEQIVAIGEVDDVVRDGGEQPLPAALVTAGHDPSALTGEHHEARLVLERLVDALLRSCEGAVEEVFASSIGTIRPSGTTKSLVDEAAEAARSAGLRSRPPAARRLAAERAPPRRPALSVRPLMPVERPGEGFPVSVDDIAS